jgi:hypothetical protein
MCILTCRSNYSNSEFIFKSSVSDPDPHSIGRPDPDPGGLKRAKIKKNAAKSQIVIKV